MVQDQEAPARYEPGQAIPLDVLDTLAAYLGQEPDWRAAYREAYRAVRRLTAEAESLRDELAIARQAAARDLDRDLVVALAEATGDSARMENVVNVTKLTPSSPCAVSIRCDLFLKHGLTFSGDTRQEAVDRVLSELGARHPNLADVPSLLGERPSDGPEAAVARLESLVRRFLLVLDDSLRPGEDEGFGAHDYSTLAALQAECRRALRLPAR